MGFGIHFLSDVLLVWSTTINELLKMRTCNAKVLDSVCNDCEANELASLCIGIISDMNKYRHEDKSIQSCMLQVVFILV